MTIREARRIIRRTIPQRVIISIAEGLDVGIRKGYSAWDSDKGKWYYTRHLVGHLIKIWFGQIRDDEGHTNGAAMSIRAMQIADAHLLRENQCHATSSSSQTRP